MTVQTSLGRNNQEHNPVGQDADGDDILTPPPRYSHPPTRKTLTGRTAPGRVAYPNKGEKESKGTSSRNGEKNIGRQRTNEKKKKLGRALGWSVLYNAIPPLARDPKKVTMGIFRSQKYDRIEESTAIKSPTSSTNNPKKIKNRHQAKNTTTTFAHLVLRRRPCRNESSISFP